MQDGGISRWYYFIIVFRIRHFAEKLKKGEGTETDEIKLKMPLGWFQVNNDHYYLTIIILPTSKLCVELFEIISPQALLSNIIFSSLCLSLYLLKLYANLRLRIPFLAIIGKIKTRNGNVNDTILCQIIHLLPLWQSCPKHALSIWRMEAGCQAGLQSGFFCSHKLIFARMMQGWCYKHRLGKCKGRWNLSPKLKQGNMAIIMEQWNSPKDIW